MRKLLSFFFIGLLVLSINSCDGGGTDDSPVTGTNPGTNPGTTPTVTDPQVRYQNAFSDGTYIMNGIRLGSAVYIGQLNSGEVTPYYSTPAGTYSVQLSDGTNWFTDSLGSFIISNDHRYTITINGTLSYYQYIIVQDSK